ncbi:hypothetical protein FALCPG4_015522 [Fusarium falciforme]
MDSSREHSVRPEEHPLQPEEPTPQQTEAYNAFCRTIVDVCKDRVTRLWRYQTFTFSAQDDQWGYSWTGRTGIPLNHFARRWHALEIVPYTRSAEDTMNMNTDPSNPSFPGTAGQSATGAEATVDEMTRNICQNRVAHMAELFLQTCPGDWNSGFGPLAYGTISRALKRDLPMEELDEIAATTAFRWEMALYADHLVEAFDLAMPGGKICILWDRQIGNLEAGHFHQYSVIYYLLVNAEFDPVPADNQGPPFLRFLYYMAAAIAITNLPEDATTALIKELISYTDSMKRFHQDRVSSEYTILQRAQDWFKEIGRRMRVAQRV